MARVAFAVIVALAGVMTACSGSEPPSTRGGSDAVASFSATCHADIVVTGGYTGHVTGPVPAAPRQIGESGRGVSIDAYLDMPQAGEDTRFLLSVFDVDGPAGPEVANALFGEVDPGVTSRGWDESSDPGTLSIAADGSVTTFDLEFGRIGVGPASTVAGSLDCPALP